MTRLLAAQRIRHIQPSVFAEMSDLAASHRAINLGQGYPDFAAPDFVKEAARAAIDADENQYAHTAGALALRSAVAAEWQSRFSVAIDPVSEVTVTSGATEAIFDAILALVDPGQAIVAFEPFYDSYPASAAMAGAEFRPVRLCEPSWSFSIDELERACSGARLLLLNTPHNPTGKVFDRTELEAIARIAIRNDLVVVTDEVYDRILFDGVQHIPIATLPGMRERTLTLNSTGKTFSVTGWKIGYAVGPQWLSAALRSVHQFVTFATSTPFQVAMANALSAATENRYYEQLAIDYDRRRELLTDALIRAGLSVLRTSGSYFLMASFAHLPFTDDVAFARWMIENVGVASIPPSAFYADPATAPRLVRFCFAKDERTLIEAGRRLAALPTRIDTHIASS